MSLDTFEQSLLRELRQHVAARTPAPSARTRRRAIRLAAGGLAVATAGVAGLAVALGLGTGVVGPSPAYAVESEPDGDVVVTVHQLADAGALEEALAAKGVRADVRYVRDFSQRDDEVRTPRGDGPAGCSITLAKVDGGLRFTLAAAQIARGSELEIVTSGSSPTDVGSPVAVVWSGGHC
jgi:hypothetical protein